MATAPNYRLGYSQKRFKPPLKKAAVQRTSSQFHYTSSPTTQYNNASSTPIQSQLSRESRELNVKLDDSLCHESSTTPDSSLEQLEESEEELSEERYTQTHTVLSYCDEVRSGGVDEAPERTSNTGGGCHVTSHLFDLNEPMNSSDEEENEDSNTHSRFVRKQQQSKTYKYDFDAILHRKVANRKRRAQKHSQPNRKQRVHIAPQPTVVRYGQARGGGATGCTLDREEGAVDHRRDLSVFDYQPTPQEGGALDGGGCGQRINESTMSKFDVSVCGRSKEEQVRDVCGCMNVAEIYIKCTHTHTHTHTHHSLQ